MERLKIKKDRFTCDIWTVITSKRYNQKTITNDEFSGYVSLLWIDGVEASQVWDFYGEKITVCDKGMKWLRILPDDETYTVTLMINNKNKIALYYIDIIKDYGFDPDGVVYVNDLFLDLIVHPKGKIKTTDIDELEIALSSNVITKEMYAAAIQTYEKLKNIILYDIKEFNEFCLRLLYEML